MTRVTVALPGLAIGGLAISTYLAAFQFGLLNSVWDPLFGSGSERVLTSDIARFLPLRDATIGAIGYALEAVLAIALAARLGAERTVAAVLAVVASGAALTSIVLVTLQPIVVGTFCTLCLVSAAISIVLAAGAITEWRRRNGAQRSGDRPVRRQIEAIGATGEGSMEGPR